MFRSTIDFIQFFFSNLHWFVFVAIVVWILIVPYIKPMISHDSKDTKKQTYYID